MKELDNKEKDIFYKLGGKLSQTDLSQEIPSWEPFSPKVSTQNFLTWGLRHFNVYYLATLLLLGTASIWGIRDYMLSKEVGQLPTVQEKELVETKTQSEDSKIPSALNEERAPIGQNMGKSISKVESSQDLNHSMDEDKAKSTSTENIIIKEEPQPVLKHDTLMASPSHKNSVEGKIVNAALPVAKDTQKVIVKNKRIITKKDSIVNQKTRKIYD